MTDAADERQDARVVPEQQARVAPPWPAADTPPPWDGRINRRRPTTAEIAVPWLIGVILLLIGICIFLLVLLLSGTGRGSRDVASGPGATGAAALGATESGGAARGVGGPAATGLAPTAPVPTRAEFGELDIAFLARDTPDAPIELLRDDFTTPEAAATVATADAGVTRHDWAPNGLAAVALIEGRAIAIEQGGEVQRPLADGVSAVTFGATEHTVYAVRITEEGDRETATVIGLDFETGEERVLSEVSYTNPSIRFGNLVAEAQFADDGGAVRLHWLGAQLCLSVPGGPTLAIHPRDGSQTAARSAPALWSPDGALHVDLRDAGNGATVLEVVDREGSVQYVASVTGLVSHIRWAPDGDALVFTLGVAGPGGGVRQDLYLWRVAGGEAPSALTSNGAAFAAEWLTAREIWDL